MEESVAWSPPAGSSSPSCPSCPSSLSPPSSSSSFFSSSPSSPPLPPPLLLLFPSKPVCIYWIGILKSFVYWDGFLALLSKYRILCLMALSLAYSLVIFLKSVDTIFLIDTRIIRNELLPLTHRTSWQKWSVCSKRTLSVMEKVMRKLSAMPCPLPSGRFPLPGYVPD